MKESVIRQENVRKGVFLFFWFWALAFSWARAATASDLSVETSDGATHHFSVELALTDQARARGLMFRTELAPDKGMLFVFPNSALRSFWMRNTLIPLDIIFIQQNGRIANIVANAEPKTDTPRQSKGRAVAVLELAGGRAAALGIGPGDLVRHPLLGTEAKP